MKIKKFEFNMFPVNCYVLSDETKEAVIIDAGCFYEEEKQALKRYIFLMARVLRAIGNQTYVIVPVLVPAKIHPLDYSRLSPLDGNSTYRNYIIDAVYNMTPAQLEEGATYEVR